MHPNKPHADPETVSTDAINTEDAQKLQENIKNGDMTVLIADSSGPNPPTDYLAETPGGYVRYRKVKTDNGVHIAVKDYGEDINVEPAELDTDLIADEIERKASELQIPGHQQLVRNSQAHAEKLIVEWEDGVEVVLTEHVHKGWAGLAGNTVWSGANDDAIVIEARDTAAAIIEKIDEDIDKIVLRNILSSALGDALSDIRQREMEFIDYAGTLELQ